MLIVGERGGRVFVLDILFVEVLVLVEVGNCGGILVVVGGLIFIEVLGL